MHYLWIFLPKLLIYLLTFLSSTSDDVQFVVHRKQCSKTPRKSQAVDLCPSESIFFYVIGKL